MWLWRPAGQSSRIAAALAKVKVVAPSTEPEFFFALAARFIVPPE
jgi:hypothetical protein